MSHFQPTEPFGWLSGKVPNGADVEERSMHREGQSCADSGRSSADDWPAQIDPKRTSTIGTKIARGGMDTAVRSRADEYKTERSLLRQSGCVEPRLPLVPAKAWKSTPP